MLLVRRNGNYEEAYRSNEIFRIYLMSVGIHLQRNDKAKCQHINTIFELIKVGHLSTLNKAIGQILHVIDATLAK
jgi:hypothetical protein